MKKIIISALALIFFTATSLVAQDDKKQEPKKKEEKKKEETKQEPAPGGTRMAINEKGLPGKKKPNSTASKTDESKKEEPKN